MPRDHFDDSPNRLDLLCSEPSEETRHDNF